MIFKREKSSLRSLFALHPWLPNINVIFADEVCKGFLRHCGILVNQRNKEECNSCNP